MIPKEIARVHLDVTGRCNLACKHCHMWDYRREQMSLDKILKILEQISISGVKRIALSGGEPLIRTDLLKILENCPRDITILTNAELVTDSLLDKLSELEKKMNKIISFKISLDGIETHEKIRGKSYKNVLENIEKIRKRGFVTLVNTMASPMMMKGELIELMKKLEALKVDQWNLDIPYNEGNYRINKLEPELEKVLPEIKEIILEYLSSNYSMRLDVVGVFCSENIKSGKGFANFSLDSHPCAYQFRSVTINPVGDIQLCPSLHRSFGNIFSETNLSNYRNSADWLEFTNKKRTSPDGCKTCKYIRVCGGGCRANSYSYRRKEWGRDDLSCRLMRFLEEDIIGLYPEKIQKQFRELLQ
jgi:radical SAM protein with 4Fe4S-binding SPASM domain